MHDENDDQNCTPGTNDHWSILLKRKRPEEVIRTYGTGWVREITLIRCVSAHVTLPGRITIRQRMSASVRLPPPRLRIDSM